MTQFSSMLPEYDNPPVVEVIFAVSWRSLPLSVVDLSRFGLEHLGDEFPNRQEQPPMHMPRESFDDAVQALAPSLTFLEGTPPMRLLFQSNDKTRLVQLQRDWLACNWQRASNDDSYPRYESIEGFFLDTWDKFLEFQGNNNETEIVVNQCELTYVNHITPGNLWERHGQVSDVIRLAGIAGDFLPEPEDAQLAFRYRIRHEDRDIGRLHVQVQPAFRREDLSPLIQLNMIARGTPIEPGREGMVSFFQLAHKWIVNGFAATTTDLAQRDLWRRAL